MILTSFLLLLLVVIHTASSSNGDLLPDPLSCGLYTSDKIIGGDKTALDEFPWMALLQFNINGNKSFECGGSLINKRYVLTAAHCVLPFLIGVRLGEYNTETDPDCVTNSFGKDCAPPVVDFGIEEKIVHKDYNPKNFYHDIALVRLDRDVKYSDFIKPVCLPLGSDEIEKTYVGQSVIEAGWGLAGKGFKSSLKLKVNITVKDLSVCTKMYQSLQPGLVLNEGEMCAGGTDRKDACKGDGGGPLMSLKFDKNEDPRFYVIGVVSHGPFTCALDNLPTVYTKVGKYVKWIIDNLKP